MNAGLQRAALAMSSNQRALDTIAANLANLGTTGYKRVRTAAHEFEVPREHGPVRGLASESRVDFGQGELKRTGRALDVALHGPGFFAVDSRRGEVYTREGSFHATAEGVLVDEQGSPIAFETRGAPIDPTGLPVEIDGEGTLRQGTTEIGRLRIVNFADPGRLRLDGQGYWSAPAGLRRVAHEATVHQGALEESNALGVEELVAMVDVQRSFESVARVMSSIADSYQTLTRPF